MKRRLSAFATIAAGSAITLLLAACNKAEAPVSSASVAKPASVATASIAQPAAKAATAQPPAVLQAHQAPTPPPVKKSYPQPTASEFAAFINAAEAGNIAVIKRYMAGGFDINKKIVTDSRLGSRAGYTAVSRAAYGGRIVALQLLVESGGYPDGEALSAGALGGNPEVVRYLLAANLRYSKGELNRAAVNGVGNPAILAALLDAGADVNFRTDKGWTPLTFAAADGRVDSVRLLLSRGANPNGADSRDTPLIMAAYRGYVPILKMLMAAGANPNAIGVRGMTPYQAARSAGKREAAEYLRAPYAGDRPPPPAPPVGAGKPLAPLPHPPAGHKPHPTQVNAVKPATTPPHAGATKPQGTVTKNLVCQIESHGPVKQKIVTYQVGDKTYAISDEARMRAKRRGWLDGAKALPKAEMNDLLKRGMAKCP